VDLGKSRLAEARKLSFRDIGVPKCNSGTRS
jgi:hypothetical protein